MNLLKAKLLATLYRTAMVSNDFLSNVSSSSVKPPQIQETSVKIDKPKVTKTLILYSMVGSHMVKIRRNSPFILSGIVWSQTVDSNRSLKSLQHTIALLATHTIMRAENTFHSVETSTHAIAHPAKTAAANNDAPICTKSSIRGCTKLIGSSPERSEKATVAILWSRILFDTVQDSETRNTNAATSRTVSSVILANPTTAITIDMASAAKHPM
mmetsp:Transcript_40741/g.93772  ORF Transcript_40741/g.93772 Transcript_40741/m.93772 type:complete len:213 (+) Transcript_40741:612-1250(+)